MRKIPATIVTGFLGAGKTSLLRHLIAHAEGRRIALLINEFGALGIDRELVLGCGIESCRAEDVVELANGCICCTVAEDFLPALEKLLDRPTPPDHILIETSGLALPKPLVQAFNWPEVKARITVDGVVAVIDAPAVAAGRFAATTPELVHDNPFDEVFGDQLMCADLVLLNKADLADEPTLASVESEIASRLRPAAKHLRTRHGEVAPSLLLGLSAAAEDDLASRPSFHDAAGEHDHDDFDSFVVALPTLADATPLLARLPDVIAAHDILRVKGFLDIAGKPFRQVVQAVGPRVAQYFDRPWRGDETRQSRLVVIGRKGVDRAAIAAALGKI
ncbi:MAG TPA: cobalamin biosynthesis protein CobW [Stellaceae bacterium]|jgi:cobalamin biosynthesis protein CobW